MRSAFGIEHGHEVSKAEQRKKNTGAGAALIGGGATVGTVGLAAGGAPVPLPVNHTGAWNVNPTKTKQWLRSDEYGNAAKIRGVTGGIGGYRTKAHKGAVKHFESEGKKVTGTSREAHFKRGYHAGKHGPEKKIIRHMRGVRAGGNVAALAGAGAIGAGVSQVRGRKVRKSDDRHRVRNATEAASGAALGVGGGVAGVAYGGEKLLRSQQKKWNAKAQQHLTRVGEHNPNMAGRSRTVSEGYKFKPDRDFKGTSNKQATAAGREMGAAKQSKYFADVYGAHADILGDKPNKFLKTKLKVKPRSLKLAGAGAAGLAATEGHKRYKARQVSKAEYPLGFAPSEKKLMNDLMSDFVAEKTKPQSTGPPKLTRKARAGKAALVLGTPAVAGAAANEAYHRGRKKKHG